MDKSEKFESLKLSINSIDDILICVNLASLLEVVAWPKPGNVHRTVNFESTRFEHFLAGICAIQPSFKNLCNRVLENYKIIQKDFSCVKLGEFFLDAANRMINSQKGGNVLLGHIMVLGVLVTNTILCYKQKNLTLNDFKNNLTKIINESTSEDSINLYKAIRKCNPGGIGRVQNYDVYNDNSFQKLKSDNINLAKIFQLSKDYDLISSEYATGFSIILTEGFPYFLKVFEETQDINIASVHTFLKILADHPDTLILRKSGPSAAKMVSLTAKEIINEKALLSSKGIKMINKLDEFLQSKKGKFNPGTSADLLAGTIFIALIFGLKF
jgi:triphosphoribosyl-dephospho-CoA synthase